MACLQAQNGRKVEVVEILDNDSLGLGMLICIAELLR